MKTAISHLPLDSFDEQTKVDGLAAVGMKAMMAVDAAENAKKRSRIDADFDRWCAENGVGR